MIVASSLFASLPATLRDELIACYLSIARNYTEERWEPTELNGGKLCEVVFTILDGATSTPVAYAGAASKPPNMVDSCRRLEGKTADSTRVGDRSLRILIPRLLPFLYEIRNNRGVGHVGGEVDPNREDAEAVMGMASWIMAELVRVFHNVSPADAQAAVDALVQKRHPLVWSVEGTKRVLDPAMSKADQTLLLLYSENGWVQANVLCGWVEYSTLATYKSNVLKALHRKRLVEYQPAQAQVRITPAGIRSVEVELLRR